MKMQQQKPACRFFMRSMDLESRSEIPWHLLLLESLQCIPENRLNLRNNELCSELQNVSGNLQLKSAIKRFEYLVSKYPVIGLKDLFPTKLFGAARNHSGQRCPRRLAARIPSLLSLPSLPSVHLSGSGASDSGCLSRSRLPAGKEATTRKKRAGTMADSFLRISNNNKPFRQRRNPRRDYLSFVSIF